MNEVKIGSDIPVIAYTRNAAGDLQDADSGPTYAVYANGSAVLTGQAFTNITTGHYFDTCTISTGNGFAVGDLIEVKATATVDSVADSNPVFVGKVVAAIAEDLPTAAENAAAVRDVSNATPAADSLGAAVNARATPAQVATELATYDGPTKAEMDARFDSTDTAIGTVATTAGNIYSDTQTMLPIVSSITVTAGRVEVQVLGIDTDAINGDAIAASAADKIAVEVESHLLDEGDSQMLINAIVGAIGNTNIDETVLVAAIRADMERTGGDLNVLVARLTSTRAGYLDNLAVAPLTDKTGFSLTSAYDPAKTAAQAGDAMALTSGERSSVATSVWASGTRTLTSFGSLIVDAVTAIWAAAARTLTDKTDFALTSEYDAAKAAAPATAVQAIQDDIDAGLEVTLADSEDVYPADIGFTIDDSNSRDEYTVVWFRNGAPVTSGITVPTIQAIKRADGTNLIPSSVMTQIASTGAYKYDAVTAERATPGEAVVVVVSATINGSTRTWRKVITRDVEVVA